MSTKPETEREELIARLNSKADVWDEIHPLATRPNIFRKAAALLAAEGKAGGEVVAWALMWRGDPVNGRVYYSKEAADSVLLSFQETGGIASDWSLRPMSFADTRPQKAAQVAQPLTVWLGSMPESNGKMNWTVMLRRKDVGELFGSIASGICFARSEYYGRMLYEADRLRYLIGETDKFPHILDYDAESKMPPDALGIGKDQA